jgi:hypothetical protein
MALGLGFVRWIQSGSYDYICETTNENHGQESFDFRTSLTIPNICLAESILL